MGTKHTDVKQKKAAEGKPIAMKSALRKVMEHYARTSIDDVPEKMKVLETLRPLDNLLDLFI